jgi:hypothetical protein
MPDDAPPTPDPDTEPNPTESAIFDLLTSSEGRDGLWSVEEITREVDSRPVDAIDALAALHRAGLIHRTSDGFIFATRAAIRARELTL